MSETNKSIINPVYGSITTAGSIPAATTKTGTIASTGKVVTGVGTLFDTRSEIREGDYVYAQNQVRRIDAIYDSLRLDVNAAFAPDLVAGTVFKVIRSTSNLNISIANIGGTTANISTITADNQDLTSGVSVKFTSSNGLGAIAYDPNGSTLVITN